MHAKKEESEGSKKPLPQRSQKTQRIAEARFEPQPKAKIHRGGTETRRKSKPFIHECTRINTNQKEPQNHYRRDRKGRRDSQRQALSHNQKPKFTTEARRHGESQNHLATNAR